MKKHTQLYYAQKYLMQGAYLTHPFFIERHRGWRLAVPIEVLRNKYGWKIETVWVENPEGRHPIALYQISKEEKNRLRQEGLTTLKSTAPEIKRNK